MSRPEEPQLVALVNGVEALVDDLKLGVKIHSTCSDGNHSNCKRSKMTLVQLARRAATPSRAYDGMATTSMGGMGGGGGSRTETQGIALATLGGNPVDPTRVAYRKALESVKAADKLLRDAVSALVEVTPKEPTEVDEWCRVCANAAATKGDRCAWCAAWFYEHGVDVPEEILEARRSGRKITERMVREVLDKPKRRAGSGRR